MPNGKQWIHFDAQFPTGFGDDIQDRFGAAGELLFVLFLCACKRNFPQGQIRYSSEEELRFLLRARFEFVDNDGDKWGIDEFWAWCGRRKVTRTRLLQDRRYVYAARWEAWEDAHNTKSRERMRRSRANSVTHRYALRGEDRGVRGEVGGGSMRGDPAGIPQPPDPAPLVEQIEKLSHHQNSETKTHDDQ